MGADSSANKYPQMPQNTYLPNLSAQAQKFWISMKKGFIGRPQSVSMTIFYVSYLSSFKEDF